MTTTPNPPTVPNAGLRLLITALANPGSALPDALADAVIIALTASHDESPIPDDIALEIFNASMGRGRGGALIRNFLRGTHPFLAKDDTLTTCPICGNSGRTHNFLPDHTCH